MKHIIKLSCIVLFCFCTFDAKSISTLDDDLVLILKNEKLDKEVFVQEGQKIKIWDNNKNSVKGEFKSIVGDTITLIVNGNDEKKYIFGVSKLRLYSTNSFKNIIGGTIATVGGISMVYGGVALVAGLAALASENLAAIVLIAVPPLGLGGYGLYKLGSRIKGKKHKIEDEWEMVPN